MLWIRIGFNFQCESGSGSRVLMTKKLKIYSWKRNSNFTDTKCIIFIPSLHEQAFRSQQRTSSTSKQYFSSFFSPLLGHFWLPGSGSGSAFPMWIRVRIQATKTNADPCGSGSTTLLVTISLQILMSYRIGPCPQKKISYHFFLSKQKAKTNEFAKHWHHKILPFFLSGERTPDVCSDAEQAWSRSDSVALGCIK